MSEDGENGMNYDFGVQIARGTVQGLAATVGGVVALTGAIVGLVRANSFFEETINKNVVALGGYANTLKGIQFANDQMMSGKGFDIEDQLSGMRQLQRAGLDAKKNFDLVADAATATGSSFNDVAGIIRGGDFNGLAEMGFITDRTAQSMNNMGYNTKRATAEVVKLMQQAKGKGLFEGAVPTMESIIKRFKAFKNQFLMAILGDPKDPEGLAFKVKESLSKAADFIQKFQMSISYYGRIIGQSLKFVFQVLGDFAKRIFKFIGKMVNYRQKTQAEMKDSMMSFQLRLALARAKINSFFDKYGEVMLKAIALFGAFKAASAALDLSRYLGRGVLTTLGKMVSMFSNLISFFRPLIMAARAFSLALSANPIGLIILAVVVLIGLIVAVVKYWDEIQLAMQNVNNGLIAAIGFFNPVIGLVMVLAKYWNEIKAIVGNLWIAAKAKFIEFYLYLLQAWTNLKATIYAVWTGLVAVVSNVWTSIVDTMYTAFKPLIDFFSNLFAPIIDSAKMVLDWLYDNFIKPIGDFFTGVGEFFSGLLGKSIDKTANMAANANSSATDSIDKKVASGLITKSRGDELKAMLSPSSDIKNNADVAEMKKDVEKRVEAKKNKSSSDTVVDVPPGDPRSALKASAYDVNGGGGGTVVQSGAVQVTINGSGLTPAQLEAAITKAIEKVNLKKGVRSGSV